MLETKPRVIAALLGLALLSGSARAAATTRYVFTTFLGDDAAKEKLSVYTSTDGLNFTLLANTNYGGPTSVLRDPSILKHTDGKYYVAYTLQSWTTSSKSFGIATSSDLQHWTFLVEVPAGVANAHDTWAPEWFADTDGVHLLVNIDTLGNDSDFQSYDFKAKDAALTEWEAPVRMGIGPNNIDTFVVKDGDTYHAFSKNETTKYIEHATAATLHGPWTWVGKDNWAGWGSGKEGIALFELDDGRWRMFLDCYSGCGFLYADSNDLNEWSATKTVPGGLSGVVRHGTVLREVLGTSDGGAGGANGDAPSNAGGTSSGGRSQRGGAGGGGNAGAAVGGAGGTRPAGSGGTIPVAGSDASGGGRGGDRGGSGASTATGGTIALGQGGASATNGGAFENGSGGTLANGAAGSLPTSSGSGGVSPEAHGGAAPAAAENGTSDPGCSCRSAAPRGRGASIATLALALLGVRRRRERARGNQ